LGICGRDGRCGYFPQDRRNYFVQTVDLGLLRIGIRDVLPAERESRRPMKAIFALILSCLCATADPIACRYFVKDGYFIVQWCNLTPNSEYFIEWSENAVDWLIESPSRLDIVEAELEMTSPSLFVRLVEYPRAVREQRETKGTN